MALQGPFFGKREGEQPLTAPRIPSNGSLTSAAASHPSVSSTPPTGTVSTPSTGTVSTTPSTSVQTFGIPTSMAEPLPNSRPENSAKLTVGPNIKLKGVEITDCDTLVIEGTVEASVNSRVLQIAEPGAYKGSAEIDLAEVRGVFDGNLTARQKLVIFATGKVTGKIRYGKIVIEEGGQISGDITVDAGGDKKAANANSAKTSSAI
jgi:cytoskeletal protein CcmA (bactofilin family)